MELYINFVILEDEKTLYSSEIKKYVYSTKEEYDWILKRIKFERAKKQIVNLSRGIEIYISDKEEFMSVRKGDSVKPQLNKRLYLFDDYKDYSTFAEYKTKVGIFKAATARYS